MTTLTGTGKLIRLILRRDRVILPIWVFITAVVPASYVATINEVYATDAARAQFAEASRSSAAFVTLYGRLEGSSLAELVAWRAGFIPIMIGLFSLLTVIRHTRTEEEAGRRELIGSTVVGRHANLAAALIVTMAANLVLAVLAGLVLQSQGLPTAGSYAFGLELAAAGWIFAGVGAVAAQLTTGAGSARGTAIIVLGAGFVMRVVGDLDAAGGGGLGWLSWLSPVGLPLQMFPFGSQNWIVLVPALALTAALAVAAIALSARRDVGAGLLPPRLGPATAAAGLRSPLALAWRLHRGLLLSWTVGFVALGLVFGGVADSVGGLLQDNEQALAIIERLGGKAALVDAFLAAIMGILGLIASGYAIQAALRLRAEESSLRAEPVLASSVGRLRWAASHFVFAALGPAVALVAAGASIGLVHGASTGETGRQLARITGAALLQLPAVWVLAAVAVALIGLAPRLAVASWGALAFCLLLMLVGSALQLTQVVLDLSPFTHIPKAPAADVALAPLAWLILIAAGLAAAGLVGLRGRDIPVI